MVVVVPQESLTGVVTLETMTATASVAQILGVPMLGVPMLGLAMLAGLSLSHSERVKPELLLLRMRREEEGERRRR